MTQPQLQRLYFEGNAQAFEDRGRSNGGKYWSARELAQMLGYENYATFEKQAINRAVATCATLGIPIVENFSQHTYLEYDRELSDYHLSRFACYLVAMNGDVRKPQVAKAQAYFAQLAEATREYIKAVEDVERVQIRDDISEREVALSSVARHCGVNHYPFFQNAGYRGMYNMDLGRLKQVKGLSDPGRSLLDFMGKRELAANLFRLTETEATMKSQPVRGQRHAEQVAATVGRRVRKAMIDSDGTPPERLPLTTDIQDVRRGLKQTAKELAKLDGLRGRKALPSGKA